MYIFDLDLIQEDKSLIWAIPSAGILCKDIEEGNFICLPICHALLRCFTGLGACIFGIPGYTEDWLRHPALWTE